MRAAYGASENSSPLFLGSRTGVETGFPHVILAGLELTMLDQVGHGFTEIYLFLPPVCWG